MPFTSPLNHKCPICSRDLYNDFQDKLFLNAFRMKNFKCLNCCSSLSWERSINLFLAILGGGLTIISGISIPIATYYLGELTYVSLIIVAVGAISAIVAWVGILRMRVKSMGSG